MTRVLVITSGKGGVGKTGIAVNAALEFGRHNHRTCLFDADLGLANANILLGIHPEKTLDDFLFRDESLENILQSTDFGFDILPGSSGVEATANLSEEHIASLVSGLSTLGKYEVLLVDTASGVAKGVMAFCLAADEIVLVITSEATSLTDGYALLKILASNEYKGRVKVVVNKCKSIPGARKTFLHLKSVVDKYLNLHLTPAGAVLEDIEIERAISRQIPITAFAPDTAASQCIRAMVTKLCDEQGRDSSGGDVGSFWSRYFRFFLDEDMDGRERKEAASETLSSLADGSEPLVEFPLVQETVSREIVSSMTEVALKVPVYINLPTPAWLFLHALELEAQGSLGLSQLQEIINSDCGLSLQVRQLVGGQGQGNEFSMPELIEYLGRDTLACWLLGCGVRVALDDYKIGYQRYLSRFWLHGYACANLARQMAEGCRFVSAEEVYTAALFHDVGRLAFFSAAPDYGGAFSDPSLESEELCSAERKRFSMDHAEMGAALLQYHGAACSVTDGARYHLLEPDAIETGFLSTRIVHLAVQLLQAGGEVGTQFPGWAGSYLDLSRAEIEELRSVVLNESREKAREWGLIDGKAQENFFAGVHRRLRNRAADYMKLCSLLPSPTGLQGPRQDASFAFLCRSLKVLFQIDTLLYFKGDAEASQLTACAAAGAGSKFVSPGLRISLDSQHGCIVKTYRDNEIRILQKKETVVLADNQLLDLLQTSTLLCLPVIKDGARREKTTAGVVVAAVEKVALALLLERMGELQALVHRASGRMQCT